MLLLTAWLLWVHSTPTASAQTETRPHVRAKQVARLVRDYRKAEKHMQTCETIAARAIRKGLPFVEALVPLADEQCWRLLKQYPGQFGKRIAAADRIERAYVLEGSQQLQAQRKRLLQQAQIANRLRDAASLPRLHVLIRKRAKPGKESIPPDWPFTSYLELIEQELVGTWIDAQGRGYLTSVEREVLVLANQQRDEHGLPPLELDYDLCLASREHSRDMHRRHYFSHTSKVANRRTIGHRARRFGTSAVAENIGSCVSAAQAVSLWMASTGHKRNILDPQLHRVGIGHVGRKYTMMFGR